MNNYHFLTRLLLAFFMLIQTAETISLKKEWSADGPWRRENLRSDLWVFPSWLCNFLISLFEPKVFSWLLRLRILAALAIPWLWHWAPLGLLLISTLLYLLHWRGAFNGGSDFISLIVLLALFVAALFPDSEKVQLGALWYISLQSSLSYFIAGWVKIKKHSWRTGKALSVFLHPTVYTTTTALRTISETHWLSLLATWTVLVFEISFPLIYLFPSWAIVFLSFGFIFHAMNVYTFGLNRFLWAWLATYPAIYFCTHFHAL